MTSRPWSPGSRWLRWDPHIHSPGTLRNNQFGNDWTGYVERIERATPAVVALGITDYFTLRGYKEVRRRKAAGALSGIALLFPNIEIRLTVETRDRQGINLHLLVCPDDGDHVELMEEKLARLRFSFRGQPYPCRDDALIRLGRVYRDDMTLAEQVALEIGANQFKVELSDLRQLHEQDVWIQKNVLFAIAAGNDGLAGIARDASFAAHREELGRFAQVVFSGIPSDRAYWLGEHSDFESNAQSPKPCLHGCDAHLLERVLAPEQDRRCWIRAAPAFEGLRQTLVEPERRVHIGADPPGGPNGSDTIRSSSQTAARARPERYAFAR